MNGAHLQSGCQSSCFQVVLLFEACCQPAANSRRKIVCKLEPASNGYKQIGFDIIIGLIPATESTVERELSMGTAGKETGLMMESCTC